MGYTHLWEHNPNDPQLRERWPQLLSDAAAIIAHAATIDIALAGPDGSGTPLLDQRDGIMLNGSGAEHGDTFFLDPEPWFTWAQTRATGDRGQRDWANLKEQQMQRDGFDHSFCKTKRRPYDAVVCAILLRARHLAPAAVFVIGAGSWKQEWRYGAESLPSQLSGVHRAHSARGIVEALFKQREEQSPLGPRPPVPAAPPGH